MTTGPDKQERSDENDREDPTLGVVAICKNEARDLPAFLEHLLPWVDEIVLVDDGSTDNTVDIARTAGDKVKVIESQMDAEGGFSEQRNIGLRAAQSNWLLHMDIDERLTPELAKEIRQVTADTTLHAFKYRRYNYFMHRPMKAGGWDGWNQPQLARRGFHRFVNKVHEKCEVQGAPNLVGQLKGLMWHLNDESYQERMAKSLQYCQLEAERMIATQTKINGLKLISMPFVEFIKKYIFKRGYIDGTPGLIAAIHSSCAVFRACALVWDAQHRIEREKLEKVLADMWKKSE